MQLKSFNVTVRIFDPAKGLDSGSDVVLPVDSPDAEHAASATLSNAVAFTPKIEGDRALPSHFAAWAWRSATDVAPGALQPSRQHLQCGSL